MVIIVCLSTLLKTNGMKCQNPTMVVPMNCTLKEKWLMQVWYCKTTLFLTIFFLSFFAVDPFGEIGSRRTAVDLNYCVHITDGDLTVDMLPYKDASTYGSIVSAMKLTELAEDECQHSIYDRLWDVWCKFLVKQQPTLSVVSLCADQKPTPWLYAINSGSGAYTTMSGISFSPDFGYWFDYIQVKKLKLQFFNIF